MIRESNFFDPAGWPLTRDNLQQAVTKTLLINHLLHSVVSADYPREMNSALWNMEFGNGD